MPALQEMVRQIRGATLRQLEATPDAWMTWAPEGTSNHIAWHLGHALWLQGVLFLEPATGADELPIGWADVFGMDCRPVRETADWPTREELRRLLTAQRERMLEVLATLACKRGSFAEPPSDPVRLANLSRSIIHGLHDEARHQGEAYLLWKLCRARAERR